MITQSTWQALVEQHIPALKTTILDAFAHGCSDPILIVEYGEVSWLPRTELGRDIRAIDPTSLDPDMFDLIFQKPTLDAYWVVVATADDNVYGEIQVNLGGAEA